MAANDSKSYLRYFNKLVDHNNNTYYHSIGRKPISAIKPIILLWLKKLRPILKLLSLKLMTESELLNIKTF